MPMCASAARAIVDGAFGNTGQNCLSVQRVFVDRAVTEELLELVVQHTRELVVGSKSDTRHRVGPLINEAAAERVEDWVDEAVDGGATVHTGAKREAPTTGRRCSPPCPAGARVLADEVFGPVVSLEPFDSVDAVVTEVNGLDYGLQAGVFTRDIDTALDLAQQLRVGAVMINDTGDFRIDAMPFGGSKRSGIGREGVPFAVEAMTEPKIIAIRRASKAG